MFSENNQWLFRPILVGGVIVAYEYFNGRNQPLMTHLKVGALGAGASLASGYIGNMLPLPDFIEAMQFQNLDAPGVIAHLGLKGFQLPDCEPEPLYKLYLGENPGNTEFSFDADPSELAPKKGKDGSRFTDSVAFLYWNERDTNPGEVREFAFSYGLGEISKPDGSSGGKLSVTTGGNTNAGKTFTLTALVKDATKGQFVMITLP